jgi:hypothetical protein
MGDARLGIPGRKLPSLDECVAAERSQQWAEQAQDGISLAFSGRASRSGLLRDRGISDRIEEIVVSPNFVSWNRVAEWLRRLETLRHVS